MDIKILYEDNHTIAVYKPAGVLVQAGDGPGHDDDTMYWQLKQFIKTRGNKPGDVFLGVLHRLDRPVSGVLLFAKTSKGAARLSEQIRNRTIKKTYHALVVGHVDLQQGTLKNYLQKDSDSFKAIMAGPEVSTDLADEAVLHYEVIKSNQNFSLLKIELETGRFHQIRAQLSAIGHPIVGDVKYGAAEQAADRSICLSATGITFMGATDQEEHTVEIPYPSEWDEKFK